jgi:pilus assembly protein CpaC
MPKAGPRPIILPAPLPPSEAGKPDAVLPPPRPLDPPPMGMKKNGDKTMDKVLGHTPPPGPKTAEKYERYIGSFIDSEATMDLIVGRTRLLILKETPKRIQIGDEGVAEYNLISRDQMSLQGRAVGVTMMTMWFTDPKDPNKEDIITFHVRVLPDPEARHRLERVYKALQDQINCAFPDSVICLHVVGDKLVVTGHAKDIAEAAQIIKIIRANSSAPGGHTRAAGIPLDRQRPGRDPNNPSEPAGQALTPGYEDYVLDGASWIVNMLKVPGEQTVNLKVTIAEVNRTAARAIGLNFALLNDQGVPYFANNTGALATGGQTFNYGFGGLGLGFGAGTGLGARGFIPGVPGIPFGSGGYANILASLDNGQVRLAISALRNLNYAKLMAEPNLTTMNGQTANFKAGGQFPTPVIATGGGGFNGFGLQGVQFQPYGIDINFTPYITDRDRIRLVLNANVTGLDVQSGFANIGNTAVPYLRQREVNTTVELREGQTLAVAGLIQNNMSGDSHRIPFFGDIPVIGTWFGFSRVTAGEQELVMLVTPELVHPLDCKDKLPLPGQDLVEPTDFEFYITGRIEGCNGGYRSPLGPYWLRCKQYGAMEASYIAGPTGYSEP